MAKTLGVHALMDGNGNASRGDTLVGYAAIGECARNGAGGGPTCGLRVPADVRLTQRVVKGARILEVGFLDHVIVGRRIRKHPGYFSFQETGLL